MISYAKFRSAPRQRFPTPEQTEAVLEWIRKPLTPRAECVAAAVAGTISFLVFFVVWLAVA